MRLVFVRESDLDHAGEAMTSAIFSGGQPIGEAEFLAIGETPERIELFDGSLHVSPGPTPLHQRVSRRLANAFDDGADALGLEVFLTVNVRLRPDRIPIPDLVISSSPMDATRPIIDVKAVRLVCEILSPSNASADKVTKMHFYATAGIEWYLLVDPIVGNFSLYRLEGDVYRVHSTVDVGEVLRLTEPVVATIDPAKLLRPPR
jgi:Uma2 family endonuclease